ncbi:hypothetical protein ACTWPF_02240 [Oceanobacillus sp. M65]|uniref:Uncharacterized protein n=1 Tax=Oceanobacillus jordanicus TaxID=2867266 RepID=A0AAW5B3U0_9BACI|nr:hypothetical protein [Oceanobacillus jordanicus]MCG3417814.1 hypothetical protein [Oceanobacillus jordanicus]
MSEWNQAYQLAKLELQASKLSFIYGFVLTMFVTLFLITTLPSYLDNGYVGYDFFFLLLFSVGAIWAKPKEFQIQKVSGVLLASPILMMQLALPIKRSVLVKSRFIIQFFYSIPYQLLFLIAFYIFSPITNVLSTQEYLAFAALWLLIGIFLGSALPVADAGDTSKLTTTVAGSIFASLILLIGSFTILTTVHVSTGEGPVYWSLVAIGKGPVASLAVALLLTVGAMGYWISYMKKRIGKQDYL